MNNLNEKFKICAYTYKYLCLPIKDCIWCEGTGHEYQEAGELSGYDYRDVCRCMKRDKRFVQILKLREDRIMEKIRSLAINPYPKDRKRVEGRKDKVFRVRVGGYRILYVIADDKNALIISDIDKRDSVYN